MDLDTALEISLKRILERNKNISKEQHEFIKKLKETLIKSTEKYPLNRIMLTGLISEVGEVGQALKNLVLEKEGATWQQVYDECIDVAVVALRLALEGDSNIAVPPKHNDLIKE
jgi:NTP pyrophosphatase (non-canonical NTP hydrolase)